MNELAVDLDPIVGTNALANMGRLTIDIDPAIGNPFLQFAA
jgi:hypothetical protein